MTKKYSKVLIVDDDYYSYVYLNELLSLVQPNLKTIHVKNGISAMEACTEHTDINLILMDIRMPKMDGIEAIDRIRNIIPSVPIIVQTAFSEEELHDLIDIDSNEIMRKPINGDEFCKIMKEYL